MVKMIISKMRKSRKSTMLSTEDSRSKWCTEHEFCIKIVHHPQPKKTHIPPPHTHTPADKRCYLLKIVTGIV